MANLTDTKIFGNLQVSRDITITGGITNNSLSPSTVLITDANKKIISSAVTSTELGYLDGVTSSIQTQLNNKQAAGSYLTTSTTFGGDVSGTYNNIVVANDSHTHSTYLPLTGGTLRGSSSSFMGLSIENTASGWSWINMRAGGTGTSGTSAFHMAFNNTAVDGALANSLHFRPGGTSTVLSINSSEVKSHVKLIGAVYNDIADFLEVPEDTIIEFGRAYTREGNKIEFTSKKRQPSIGIASDTFGFGVGRKEKGKELPIAIGGWVLAYVDKEYKFGTELIASKNGTLTKANLFTKVFYSNKIIAIFDRVEKEETWNGVEVRSRSWVKVK